MFSETLGKLSNSAVAKVTFFKESKPKYFIASLLAGFYVGIGIVLITTIGGLTKSTGPQFRIYMGLAFGIALTLVIMAGSELFTGNNLIMSAGAADKKVSWKDAINIWILSYIGNLAGSTLIGSLFILSGSADKPHGAVGEFIVALSKAKMTADPSSLFFKGVLCNVLVCLAVLCCIKMKEETAKLVVIFWCLFAFITAGFEHSIANMTIFTMGLLLPHGPEVSLLGYGHNMLWVTLGNFVGGSALGLCYYYMGKKSKVKESILAENKL
ncbi:formate/nitrite transporter family protein [Ilyobacter sp.]|uniref:formate/nitrite transporter family protein n=1 Tax=Ilyobacter sp. TaxID=3100343 RepID=UPI003562DFC7